jgi:hypothetical protein
VNTAINDSKAILGLNFMEPGRVMLGKSFLSRDWQLRKSIVGEGMLAKVLGSREMFVSITKYYPLKLRFGSDRQID